MLTLNYKIMICMTVGLCSHVATGCNRPTEADASKRPTRPALRAPRENAFPSFYTVAHYGEDRDVEADLQMTLVRAVDENKRVLLQVGGEWCGWCKSMSRYFEKNENVRALLEKNYLLMKVTYTQNHTNEAFLSKYPKIRAYPHLFVLDAEGKLLHSQDTAELEDGKDSYVEEKAVAFLEEWKIKE